MDLLSTASSPQTHHDAAACLIAVQQERIYVGKHESCQPAFTCTVPLLSCKWICIGVFRRLVASLYIRTRTASLPPLVKACGQIAEVSQLQ